MAFWGVKDGGGTALLLLVDSDGGSTILLGLSDDGGTLLVFGVTRASTLISGCESSTIEDWISDAIDSDTSSVDSSVSGVSVTVGMLHHRFSVLSASMTIGVTVFSAFSYLMAEAPRKQAVLKDTRALDEFINIQRNIFSHVDIIFI